MKFLKNKYVKSLITILVVGIVGYFFYGSLNNNWDKVQSIGLDFNAISVLSVLIFALAVIVSGVIWGRMVVMLSRNHDKSITTIEAIEVQIMSWLLKYIPGQAGSAVNKIVWAKKRGFGKKLILITFIYENIFLISASLIIGMPIIIISSSGGNLLANPAYILAVVVALGACALVLNRKTMYPIMNSIFSKLIKQPVTRDLFLTNKESLIMQAYYLVPRIINAVGFVLIVASVMYIEPSLYVPLGAAYVVAGAIGIMAIFVPSGIGVREAVIVLIASQFISIELAIVASLLARFYSTLADGVLAGVYLFIKLKRKAIRS